MRVLVRYKDEKRFRALEVYELECTPYPEAGRVEVKLHTPVGSAVLVAEGDVERIVDEILNGLLSGDDYMTHVVVRDVVREGWGW